MPIEIEKKYRLTEERCRAIGQHLSDLNAEKLATEFEVNTIYRNAALEQQGAVLRLRRIDDRAILTFKRRFTSTSPIKRQLEEETEVRDADAMARILDRLGSHRHWSMKNVARDGRMARVRSRLTSCHLVGSSRSKDQKKILKELKGRLVYPTQWLRRQLIRP